MRCGHMSHRLNHVKYCVFVYMCAIFSIIQDKFYNSCGFVLLIEEITSHKFKIDKLDDLNDFTLWKVKMRDLMVQ